MKLSIFLIASVVVFVSIFAAVYFLGSHPGGERSGVLSSTAWQRMASPGTLSRSHAFLEHNCAACHASVTGVEAANCIVCHATNAALLQRQPTAFHVSVSSCTECHREHRGVHGLPAVMDHAALARVGLRQLKAIPDPETEGRVTSANLTRWLNQSHHTSVSPSGNDRLGPLENILNCATCHSSKDKHVGLLGQDCAQCHTATAWTIAEFRHPSPTSQDCAQCHQAPPSHSMMHFKMVSMSAAGVAKAEVNQCFLCHQTTSWNDIKGVGYYKHH